MSECDLGLENNLNVSECVVEARKQFREVENACVGSERVQGFDIS